MFMPRTRKSQTCHNRSVRRRAAGLKANGWNVKADISGYRKPSTLNGSRPDIDARKGGKRRIIEVETKDSRNKDKQQQRNLRSYARSRKDTQFMTRTCRS